MRAYGMCTVCAPAPRLSRRAISAKPIRDCKTRAAADKFQDVDAKYDWVARYQSQVRSLPIASGAIGFITLLLNRSISEVAPIVDASSSQSRTDILVVAMAASLALTGFQWLTLAPIAPKQVEPTGKEVYYVRQGFQEGAEQELAWVWEALKSSTRCRSLVIVHSKKTMLQAGLACPGCKTGKTPIGTLCKDVMANGRANYLGNLMLFPGRTEFETYLPPDMSAVIIAPIGRTGVLIAGSDTQRGFGRLDQAWISAIADKLEDTFEVAAPAGSRVRY